MSTIYVSAPPNSAFVNPEQFNKRFVHPTQRDQHYYLLFNSPYTEQLIEACNGALNCYNCARSIRTRVWFYPEMYNVQTMEATCNPRPHCRTECALRTVHDIANNGDLKCYFTLFYGHNVHCAPPRTLLYIPGGMTNEQYHESIDAKVSIEILPPNIKSFIAPVYVSSTCLADKQLVPDIVSLIDEMKQSRQHVIGPPRQRDNSSMDIRALPPQSLLHTGLSDMFHVDPASFQCMKDNTNPHMV